MILHGRVTFNSLVDKGKRDVLKEAKRVVDPEGDIEPRIYLYRPESQSLHVHDIPRVAFSSADSKAILMDMITTLVKVGDVTLAATQATAYMARYNLSKLSDEERRAALEEFQMPQSVTRPTERPDRQEGVQLIVFDAEINQAWWCPIRRAEGKRPVYGPWRVIPEMVSGANVQPITEALR